jgi:hypothetical protein
MPDTTKGGAITCLSCQKGGGTLRKKVLYYHQNKECVDALEDSLAGLVEFMEVNRAGRHGNVDGDGGEIPDEGEEPRH